MNEIEAKEVLAEEVGADKVKWLNTRHAGWLLAVISFVESVFAPIIIDPFLSAFIIGRRDRWLRYTLISIVFSVLGGVAGYFLGALFFDFVGTKIIAAYGLEAQFAEISLKLSENGFVFVLLGALTPIPYKLVAIASGLAHVSLVTFIFASVLGRVLRLATVGYATYVFGPAAMPLVRKHFLKLTTAVAVLLIVYLIVKFL